MGYAQRRKVYVSISQSRCFSFQEIRNVLAPYPLGLFQSRNRDAFHFRSGAAFWKDMLRIVSISQSRCFSFQVPRVRWYGRWRVVSISQSRCFSFQGGKDSPSTLETHSPFQSRNRDAFHFRHHSPSSPCMGNEFQSRNRDAFHFRHQWIGFSVRRFYSFNLVIEMLFISGRVLRPAHRTRQQPVSIS